MANDAFSIPCIVVTKDNPLSDYTKYFNSHFILRFCISANGESAITEENSLMMNFHQCGVKLDLTTVAHVMQNVLVSDKSKKYCFHRVMRSWHDNRFPICDVYFQSATSLRSFMEAKEEAEEDMKQAVLSLLESSSHTQPCPAISVNALLYLMHPRKDNPQLFLVTEGNCQNILTEYEESFLFEFQDKLFSSENTEGKFSKTLCM